MNVNNSSPSFGSTKIFLAKDTPVVNKFTNKVAEYFELKGFMGPKYSNNHQLVADQLDFSQAAILPSKDGLIFIGKDGGQGGADNFIAKLLKDAFPNEKIEHTENIAPVKLDGPVIDLNV